MVHRVERSFSGCRGKGESVFETLGQSYSSISMQELKFCATETGRARGQDCNATYKIVRSTGQVRLYCSMRQFQGQVCGRCRDTGDTGEPRVANPSLERCFREDSSAYVDGT